MTCIVAIKEKRGRKTHIVMGGDSAGSSGWDTMVRKDPKVFRNGEFIIGYTTSFRMGQLLRCKFTPPPIPDDQDLFLYMVYHFVDSARECFKQGGYSEVKEAKESGGTFLIGVRDRLFTIMSDFQVAENVDEYACCGCGEPYALGSLATQPKGMPINERAIQALEVAEKFSNGVRGPFVVLSTEAWDSQRRKQR